MMGKTTRGAMMEGGKGEGLQVPSAPQGQSERETFEESLDFSYIEFYNNPLYSDVTIIAEDTPFHAHRIMLHRSPFFSALLNSGMKEVHTQAGTQNVNTKSTVTLQDISASCVEAFLRYLYGDPLQDLSLEECVILYRETARFLTSKFTQTLWNLILDHHQRGLSFSERTSLIKLATTYTLKLPPTQGYDLHTGVIAHLSLDDMIHLLTHIEKHLHWGPIFIWITCHPKVPDTDTLALLNRCPIPVLSRNELKIMSSYREVSVLRSFIIETMEKSLNNVDMPVPYHPLSPSSYESVKEILKKIENQEEILEPPSFPKMTPQGKSRPTYGGGVSGRPMPTLKEEVSLHVVPMKKHPDKYKLINSNLVVRAVGDKVVLVGISISDDLIIPPTNNAINEARQLGIIIESERMEEVD